MADTRGGLVKFVAEAERHDLPVKFLKYLLHSSYSYSSAGASSFVLPTFNHMVLEKNVIEGVTPLSLAAPLGEMTAIQTIYHEATHAWLDLQEDNPEVAALMKDGIKHYKGAPLMRGAKKADDPERIFHEAMGSYVGHRPSRYWGTLESLTFVDSLCTKGPPPDKRAFLLKMTKRARSDYESAMADRVFGYQNGPGMFSVFREQNDTTRMITDKMKEFCDRVLLEGKIPDQFDRKAPLVALWSKLRKTFYPDLG